MTYASSGWTSYGDFLGYAVGKQVKSTKESKFRTFEDARTYVCTLGLKSWKEWRAWSSSGARPHDIPCNPNVTYASSGWTSFGDFLGYADGKVTGSFRSFEDARAYVRTLGLNSAKEWSAWSSSGARPHDLPSTPNVTYASSGWTSFGDFLGYAVGKQAKSTKESKFRTFEDARAYVRTLGLKGQKEWSAWSKSGARPHDMPSSPQRTYASSGWTSWGDFLGYADGKVTGSFRSFEADECGVCFEALVNGDGRRALFFPCLHAKQCLSCAMRVWESASPTGDVTCPWCSAVLNAPPVAIWM